MQIVINVTPQQAERFKGCDHLMAVAKALRMLRRNQLDLSLVSIKPGDQVTRDARVLGEWGELVAKNGVPEDACLVTVYQQLRWKVQALEGTVAERDRMHEEAIQLRQNIIQNDNQEIEQLRRRREQLLREVAAWKLAFDETVKRFDEAKMAVMFLIWMANTPGSAPFVAFAQQIMQAFVTRSGNAPATQPGSGSDPGQAAG